MKVLIADDSLLILTRLQEMISAFRNVEIAAIAVNGTDALNTLKSMAIDLLIMDLNMPEINGMELIKDIRKANQSLKIIVLTFHSSDHHRHLAMTSGADYFFNKEDAFEKIPLILSKMISEQSNNNIKLNGYELA
jgi:DNA-binding NarL/FixJ family response regulator